MILAHKNTYVLQKALEMIDDESNDVFIHIDKKSPIEDFEAIKGILKKSNLFFTERINVNWASFSQLEAELLLLESAIKRGDYAYFHLISESDMPIKSQAYIHDHLSGKSLDYIEMCGVSKKPGLKPFSTEIWNRYYYFFTETPLYRTSRLHKFFVRIALVLPQKLLGVNRWKNVKNSKGENIYPTWGWQWFSLSKKTAEFILSQKEFLCKHFKNTHCPDECAIPTLLWNYGDLANVRESKRNIIFTGKPSVITMDDYERLVDSDDFFARKFDEKTDKKVIDKIYERVMNSENEQ